MPRFYVLNSPSLVDTADLSDDTIGRWAIAYDLETADDLPPETHARRVYVTLSPTATDAEIGAALKTAEQQRTGRSANVLWARWIVQINGYPMGEVKAVNKKHALEIARRWFTRVGPDDRLTLRQAGRPR